MTVSNLNSFTHFGDIWGYYSPENVPADLKISNYFPQFETTRFDGDDFFSCPLKSSPSIPVVYKSAFPQFFVFVNCCIKHAFCSVVIPATHLGEFRLRENDVRRVGNPSNPQLTRRHSPCGSLRKKITI
jgi:hypothetical protein